MKYCCSVCLLVALAGFFIELLVEGASWLHNAGCLHLLEIGSFKSNTIIVVTWHAFAVELVPGEVGGASESDVAQVNWVLASAVSPRPSHPNVAS